MKRHPASIVVLIAVAYINAICGFAPMANVILFASNWRILPASALLLWRLRRTLMAAMARSLAVPSSWRNVHAHLVHGNSSMSALSNEININIYYKIWRGLAWR